MIKQIIKKIINFYKFKRSYSKITYINKIMNENKISILDIGAAGGIEQFQDSWQPFINRINFILCEPHEESFNSISSLKTKVIDKALSDEIKTNNIFYETRKPECSSMKEINYDYLKKFPFPERFEVVKKKNISTTTIDNEFKILDSPHFIKIDTEGSELDILKGASETLKNTLGLVVEIYFTEYHKNQVKFDEIKNFLNSKNFEFIDFINLTKWERNNHRHHGQIQAADVLFLIPPENILSRLNKKKIDINILKIYIFILVVYNRSDYLQFIMINLDEKIKKKLYLQEGFDITEKHVKKIHLYEKIFKYFITHLT